MVDLYARLDMILAETGREVGRCPEPEMDDGGYVFMIDAGGDGGKIIIHGAKPYTRDEAYEDALREALGLTLIADMGKA